MKNAYIWMREYSRDSVIKMQELQVVWDHLFNESRRSGHYSKIQWRGKARFKTTTEKIQWEGKLRTMHIRIISTMDAYAKEVFERALAQTRARYPKWDSHYYEDGSRIGERILEFTSEEHDFACSYMYLAMLHITKDEPPQVMERVTIQACNSSWQPITADISCAEELLVTVILHQPSSNGDDLRRISLSLCNGNLPEVSHQKFAPWSWEDLYPGFSWLSSHELTWLNWEDARKAASELDLELFDAIEHVDLAGVKDALDSGSDPNCFNAHRVHPLAHVVYTFREYLEKNYVEGEDTQWEKFGRRWYEQASPPFIAMIELLLEYGAHPDLHAPGQEPVLNIVTLQGFANFSELLINHGAQTSIDADFDMNYTMTPPLWDSLLTDVFHMKYPDEIKIFNHLMVSGRPSYVFDAETEKGYRKKAFSLLQTNKNSKSEQSSESSESVLPLEIRCPLPINEATEGWIAAQKNAELARAYVGYACAYNTLDEQWLEGLFAEDVKYESQSSFDTRVGRSAVKNHFVQKFGSIKDKPYLRPRMELGSIKGRTCLIAYQSQSPVQEDLLRKPIMTVSLELDDQGYVKNIFNVTVVPPPSQSIGTGICPLWEGQ